MYDLSIVIPTYNRSELLERCFQSLREGVHCAHEIIVIDGASTDNTVQVLETARAQLGERLQVIREPRREGFVKAANKGFRSGSGRNMTWLNDDARPMPGALDEAVAQMDAAGIDIAFLAMFHRWHSTRDVAYETPYQGRMYRICHVRGTLFANFAIGRRSTFEHLDYFDERYFFQGADADLSLKAWNAGMRIEPAYSVLIDHDEYDDQRREADSTAALADNEKLLAKWDLPANNPFRNDFDPTHPCTLHGPSVSKMAVAA
jgi:GT2 family glycosyltransferase